MPIVIPIVWLGLYAGRNYTLSIRLEEEYAFKEAVSAAFEGYKREMQGIGKDADGQPITELCNNVLNALAQRPGRIYEGKHDDVTPLTALNSIRDMFGQLMDRIPSKSPEAKPPTEGKAS